MSNTQPPARKIEIFYWRSAKKTHWYNYCVPEIIKAIEDYEIDRICRLKPLDFFAVEIDTRNQQRQLLDDDGIESGRQVAKINCTREKPAVTFNYRNAHWTRRLYCPLTQAEAVAP